MLVDASKDRRKRPADHRLGGIHNRQSANSSQAFKPQPNHPVDPSPFILNPETRGHGGRIRVSRTPVLILLEFCFGLVFKKQQHSLSPGELAFGREIPDTGGAESSLATR
jgi:hypothetical protein